MQRQLKRAFDWAVALVLSLLSIPVMILAALLIWLEDQSPIFYVHQHSGWMGEPFELLKLRTMTCADPEVPVLDPAG